MTIKSIYLLIIRVFGLIILKDVLVSIAYVISPILVYFNSGFDSEGLGALIFPAVYFAFLVCAGVFLVLRPHKLVGKLRLEEEELNEPLTVSVSASSVILVSLILLSGLLLIDEIPNFCKLLYQYYEESQVKFSDKKPSIVFLLFSLVKILLGLLVFGERRRIMEFISRELPVKE